MRLIDADELDEHKFVREEARSNDYKRGWNDAIEAIIDNAPTVEFPEQITIKCDTEEDKQKLLSAFRNARVTWFVEEEKSRGEWIPVKERLPDKNGRYLVTNYNLVCLRRFSVARNEFGYFDNTDESYESRWVSVPQVTAWMPLPEPYKEEENE